MLLAGLDIGTTGCKSTLLTVDGQVVATAYQEYITEQPIPGRFEMNPLTVWESVQNVLLQTMKEGRGQRVTAICVSSFGETVVPVDHNGRVLANAILYNDERGSAELEILRNRLGDAQILALTGVPPHPMYTINKLMWIKHNQPEIYSATWKFMLVGSFINYCLTGSCVVDQSLAARTMAFNPIKAQWEPTIFAAAEVDSSLLPDFLPAGQIINRIKPEIAELLGISKLAVAVNGGHDQACAALGTGVLSEGSALDGIGTVECITPVYSKPIVNKKMLTNNFNCSPHVVDGLFLTFAFNFTGGSLIKWYRDNFAQEAIANALKKGISVYDVLNQTAAAKPTDLLVIPHFSGSGTPHMRPDLKGVIYGLGFNTTPSQLYRALLEGVTYEMLYNVECLHKIGIPIRNLYATGGGAKSELWLQLKADIMGMDIQTMQSEEAGTVGCAILAGLATGAYANLEDAVNQQVRFKKTFVPNPVNRDFYLSQYENYKTLSQVIRKVSSKIIS